MNDHSNEPSDENGRSQRRIVRILVSLAIALPLVAIGLMSGACGTSY